MKGLTPANGKGNHPAMMFNPQRMSEAMMIAPRQSRVFHRIPALCTLFATLALLSGCGGQRVATISAPQGPALSPTGLERILGANSHQLLSMLGRPAQQVSEGQGTRMQFSGPVCVLDAYLYPRQAGGQPVVTYLDARRPNGDDIDRASCLAALTAR